MSLLHDHDLEASLPARGRDLDRGPELGAESTRAAHPSPEARTDAGVPSPPADVPGAWGTLLRAGHHGGLPRLRRSIAGLHGAAGNAAVAGLLGAGGGGARATRRVGPTLHHAGDVDVPAGDMPRAATEPLEGATPLEDEGGAPAAPALTSSFTKVGPPTRSSYTVSGTLRQAANAVAARPEAGATVTTPVLDIAADSKWPTHVQVTVGQAVELPEWDGKAAATQNQRNEWDRFKAAITAHEDGHVAKDQAAFANAHVKIKAKPTRPAGEKEFDTIVAQADTDNDAFDAKTDHGRNAGTNINPNIDEVTKVP